MCDSVRESQQKKCVDSNICGTMTKGSIMSEKVLIRVQNFQKNGKRVLRLIGFAPYESRPEGVMLDDLAFEVELPWLKEKRPADPSRQAKP